SLLGGLLFALPPAVSGQPAKDLRTDALGDPLPSGVIARLGTRRLAHYSVDDLTFSRDGRTLASHSFDGVVVLWETETGKELRRLKLSLANGLRSTRSLMALSADGKLVALVGEDKVIHVWESATGRELHGFPTPHQVVNALAISPDGRQIASGGSPG